MTQPKQNRKAVHRLAHWTGLSYAKCKQMLFHIYNDSSSSEWLVDHLFETAAKENPQLFCPFFKSPKLPPEMITEGIYESYRRHTESLMREADKRDTKVLPKGITKETKYKIRGHLFKKLSDAVLFDDIMKQLEKHDEVFSHVRLEYEKRCGSVGGCV
ncbi:hypothetical protein [uncultured Cohaesibacter sp.]|uniref:hypothetical protein n=1 Tax=uncultured Cohaesibacter sp. TaxID=1002546 RepID=UPI002AA70C06|nr:hypothetical protein [uncultured Cohaesibacter sp.]